MSVKTPTEFERERLPAERKFDSWVYGGISYAAQAVAGSALAYWIRHAGGKLHFDKMANWLGPKIGKLTGHKGAEAVGLADAGIVITTMVAVGTAFVAPVKWLEDIKLGIVEKWTKQENDAREKAGNPLTPSEKAHQAELLAELKAAPKQNWASLLTARLASLVPVYTVYPLMGKFNKAMEGNFQKLTKSAASLTGLKKLSESKAFHNASGIAFYDGFYSLVSAGGLYVYSHYISPPQEKALADKAPEMPVNEIPDNAPSEHRTMPVKKPESFVEQVTAPTPPSMQAAL